MPNLKHNMTQFLTQVSDSPAGTITGFIAASFRVWEWSTQSSTPMQINSVAMDLFDRDAIVVKDANLLFICDGGFNNFLYAVDTTSPLVPVILSHIDLSAP